MRRINAGLGKWQHAIQLKCQNTNNTNDRIWLADLAKRLPNASSVYLHGFDVSDAQFPPETPTISPTGQTIPLSVHDALKPFPPEHNGRYDLVHIRLLTAGLKQDDYTIVLNNARNLLSKVSHHFILSILSDLHLQNPTAGSNGEKSTVQCSAPTNSPSSQQ